MNFDLLVFSSKPGLELAITSINSSREERGEGGEGQRDSQAHEKNKCATSVARLLSLAY